MLATSVAVAALLAQPLGVSTLPTATAASALTGTVLRGDGSPAVDALVGVVAASNVGQGTIAAFTTTDADGNYSLPNTGLPAKFVVRVCDSVDGTTCRPTADRVFADSYVGPGAEEPTWLLLTAYFTAAGVTDGSQAVAPTATVDDVGTIAVAPNNTDKRQRVVLSTAPDDYANTLAWGWITGTKGFVFEGLAPGKYRVARDWSGPSRVVTVHEGETVSTLLSKPFDGASVAGRVTVNGKPAARKRVYVSVRRNNEHWEVSTLTNKQGRYVVNGLMAEQVDVATHTYNGSSKPWAVPPVSKAVDLKAGQRVVQDFALRAGTISGTLGQPWRCPKRNSYFSVALWTPGRVRLGTFQVPKDFTFKNVPAGVYHVVGGCTAPVYMGTTRTSYLEENVRVRAGKTTRLGTLKGSPRDANITVTAPPQSWVMLALRRSDSTKPWRFAGRADWSGLSAEMFRPFVWPVSGGNYADGTKHVFSPVGPGDYTLFVTSGLVGDSHTTSMTNIVARAGANTYVGDYGPAGGAIDAQLVLGPTHQPVPWANALKQGISCWGADDSFHEYFSFNDAAIVGDRLQTPTLLLDGHYRCSIFLDTAVTTAAPYYPVSAGDRNEVSLGATSTTPIELTILGGPDTPLGVHQSALLDRPRAIRGAPLSRVLSRP